MNFGSLFSGIGGFDLGFEQAGLSCQWQVEIDADCSRALERHWPEVTRYKDVRDVRELEPVDVICGGFPCQDLSVAGKRAGLAGERSGLWFEFLRIIELNRPRWLVIENVPGLLSSDEGRDFAVILRGLVECGYCLAWRVLDAQFFRVAQRRRRVFIVGSLGDGSCAEILFESESVSWNPPTRREARTGVARTISGGAHPGGHNGQDDLAVIPIQEVGARESKHQNGVGIGIGKDRDAMYTLQAGQIHGVAMPLKAKANSSHDESHETYVTHALRSEGVDASEDGTRRGTPLVAAPITSAFAKHHGRTAGKNCNADNLVVNCFNGYTGGPDDNDAQANHLIAFSSKDHAADAGEIAPTLRSQNFKDSHINGGGQAAIAWALHSQNSCAMTGDGDAQAAFEVDKVRSLDGGAGFTAGQGGNLLQQSVGPTFGVRRLTPRECERLQGFPDDWTRWDANGKEISDSARYRMLGNAVCVKVAKWLGKQIAGING